MEAETGEVRPASTSVQTWNIRLRAAATCVAMSAIRNRMAWFCAMGRPNWTRCFA